MTRVCGWCGRCMGQTEAAPHDQETTGICGRCQTWVHMTVGELEELAEVFERKSIEHADTYQSGAYSDRLENLRQHLQRRGGQFSRRLGAGQRGRRKRVLAGRGGR